MTIRAARGGTAVRWTYGVFLTLCVVLAVFAHHGTPAMDSAAMSGPMNAAHAMPPGTAPSLPGATAHSADDCTCTGAMPGMQHCSAAGVDSVQLAAPDRTAFDPLAKLRQAAAGRVPGAAATGRAPPDLSVLSQLRI
ncbi:DUF6153 family protein [Streptomyces sp. NPDC058464]|uniref:DUF6153 family protein n=1 Tax=Streptomyces sp. NPDC058464 TaxID=3346511 RepID=UPI0036608003